MANVTAGAGNATVKDKRKVFFCPSKVGVAGTVAVWHTIIHHRNRKFKVLFNVRSLQVQRVSNIMSFRRNNLPRRRVFSISFGHITWVMECQCKA
jgi:hypothetical protein